MPRAKKTQNKSLNIFKFPGWKRMLPVIVLTVAVGGFVIYSSFAFTARWSHHGDQISGGTKFRDAVFLKQTGSRTDNGVLSGAKADTFVSADESSKATQLCAVYTSSRASGESGEYGNSGISLVYYPANSNVLTAANWFNNGTMAGGSMSAVYTTGPVKVQKTQAYCLRNPHRGAGVLELNVSRQQEGVVSFFYGAN